MSSYTVPTHSTAAAQLLWAEPLPGVRAGSALVRHRDRLLLAQDDDYTLVWLRPGDNMTTQIELVPLRERSGAMAKVAKPDFEAACGLPDGRILVMGSGSAEPRRAVVLLDPETSEFAVHNAERLYDLVTDALGHEMNIEAVIPHAGGLRLFHRGNSGPGNATIDLLVDVSNPAAARVGDIRRWHIGTVPGEASDVALTFTDADIDSTGRAWFVSAAEDTPNAIDDGPVVGAGIGLLSDAESWWVPITEADGTISCRKFEGLVMAADRQSAWLVTDPDDEHSNAELCKVQLMF